MKRDYQGVGHPIVANEYNSEVTTTFTIVDFPYVARYLADYFTEERVASISISSFSVTLPAFGTAVYHLTKIAYSMWIHGHNLQVEYPQQGTVERKGFSAKYKTKRGANWLHFAIPTLVIVNETGYE